MFVTFHTNVLLSKGTMNWIRQTNNHCFDLKLCVLFGRHSRTGICCLYIFSDWLVNKIQNTDCITPVTFPSFFPLHLTSARHRFHLVQLFHRHQKIMVRNYMRKTMTNYTDSDVKKALDDVRSKQLKPSAAAKKFNIPVATLHAWLSGIRGNGPPGAKTILSPEEEAFLVQTIEIFEKWQLPLLRKSLIDIARTYMLELGKKISLTAELTEWFVSFMSRHRDLKIAKCENLEKAWSVSCTPQVISKLLLLEQSLVDQNHVSSLILEGWFETLHEVLSKHKLFDRPNAIQCGWVWVFDDPGRRSAQWDRINRPTHSTCSSPIDKLSISASSSSVDKLSTTTTIHLSNSSKSTLLHQSHSQQFLPVSTTVDALLTLRSNYLWLWLTC